MAASDKAIGYLELNSKQFDEAIAAAQKALIALGGAFAAVKSVEFWKNGIEGALAFGNAMYFASQKLNGYDPGRLFIAQKALQGAGLSAEEARGKIEEFALAGRPLEQMFKGGSAGFGDALGRAAREYGTQAAVLSKSAEEFAYVQGQIGALGTKLEGFFLGLADKIANPLSALLAQIDKIDLVGMGEKFGGYVVDAINAIKGLIQNNELFSALGLALRVSFEVAVDFLLAPSTWAGIVKVALGSLALIGNFLTSVFLGIGKLLTATIEAALARITDKYRPFLLAGGLAGAALYQALPSFSTSVGKNLDRIENGSLIQDQEKGAAQINAKALATALSGINDLIKSGKTIGESQADLKKLQDLLAKASLAGAAITSPNGTKNPIFSETADPYHVIADSLARVGGGGRYVRTGLSIADKAALDSIRYQQQQLDVQKKIEKNTAKSNPSQGMAGG